MTASRWIAGRFSRGTLALVIVAPHGGGQSARPSR